MRSNKNKKSKNRDLERTYSRAQFLMKLKRLSQAIKSSKGFSIQIAGERISVPASAIFNIEHEREGQYHEIEYQLKWSDQPMPKKKHNELTRKNKP